jgi:hypothetical protein
MVEDTGAAGEAVQHIALYVTTLKLDFARTCSAISLSSPLSGKVTQTFLGQIIVKCEMILKEAKLCPKFMRKDITEEMRNDVFLQHHTSALTCEFAMKTRPSSQLLLKLLTCTFSLKPS